MVPQTGIRQRQERRRKEHSLIIWMRDQETYALIPQLGELGPRNGYRVQPARDDDDREQGHGEPLHGAFAGLPSLP